MSIAVDSALRRFESAAEWIWRGPYSHAEKYRLFHGMREALLVLGVFSNEVNQAVYDEVSFLYDLLDYMPEGVFYE